MSILDLMFKPLIAFIIIVVTLASCSGSDNYNNVSVDTSTHEPQLSKAKETFSIDGESVLLRKEPSTSSAKIINEKATQTLGETTYCEVDQSTKVEILQVKNSWTKIRVIEPEWLSDTHIGWIPSKYILNKEVEKSRLIGKLSSKDYEILETEHNTAVQNFHVLLKRKKFDKEYVYQFVKQFRVENCNDQCNVSVYDSKVIKPLIGVYPLEDSDYLKMADHLISLSTFDATEVRDWYPYQDFHYKELGGKNLKK